VAAGGWFGHLADTIGGPELRDVMRQHDPAERSALAEVHDGNPDPYSALKLQRGDLEVHAREADGISAAVADWDRAQREYGVNGAVVIARDNATRDTLNAQARQLRPAAGDVDNGTLGTVVAVGLNRLSLTVETDGGELRPLDVAYVDDHLEHAYALTGHGAQGATVDWAAVVGRPSELTREWAYTALSRACDNTRIHLISESPRSDQERARYAPRPPRPGLRQPEIARRQHAMQRSRTPRPHADSRCDNGTRRPRRRRPTDTAPEGARLARSRPPSSAARWPFSLTAAVALSRRSSSHCGGRAASRPAEDHSNQTQMGRTPASRLRFMDSTPLTPQERRRAERDAPVRSADDRTVLVGMKRPATPGELRAFIDREQARIRTERGLAPAG
jgi:hypothetical protein